MQDVRSLSLQKKLLYAGLGVLGIVIIAGATAFILAKTLPSSEPNTDQSKEVDSFSLLYRQSAEGASQTVLLATPDIQDGSTEGYKVAKAKVLEGEPNERLTAIFYSTPDQTWHYFAAAKDQDTLNCDLYNTDELINTFTGFTCQTSAGEVSYVQSPQPTFEITGGSGN